MTVFSKTLLKKEIYQLSRKISLYILSFFFISFLFLYYFIYSNFFSFTKLIPLSFFFSIIPFIYIFIIPFLTMLSWIEEGLFLESLAFSTAQKLFAKLISLFLLIFLLLIITIFIPVIASVYMYFDWAEVFLSYVFLLFYGFFLLSLGQLVFILFKNNLISFLILSFSIALLNNLFNPPWAFKGIFNFFECASLILVGIFLYLCTIYIKEKQKGRKIPSKSIILAIVFFLLCIINLMIFSFNKDFTKQKTFTIEKETKELFQNLDDKILIEYYLSPSLEKNFQEVKEVKEYLQLLKKRVSLFTKNPISLHIIDPEKLSSDELKKLSIEGQQIQSTKKGQTIFETLYSTIRIHYLDKSQTISFVFSINGLEYNIFTRVQNLIHQIENKVYILKDVSTSYENYSLCLNVLIEEGFQPIDIETMGIENLDIEVPLLIIGTGEKIDEKTAFIESFLMQGGRAAFFVSPVDVLIDSDWSASIKPPHILFDMLSFWGFELEKGLVLDLENQVKLPMQNLNTNAIEIIDYALWPKIEKNIFQSPITHKIERFQFYWPSSIQIFPSEDFQIQAIFSSSEHSLMQKEEDAFVTDPFELSRYSYENQIRQSFVLAAIGEGNIFGYYSLGKSKPTKIIVIADELSISNIIDNFDNLKFLSNSLLYLTDKIDLIKLKNKTQSKTGFKEIVFSNE